MIQVDASFKWNTSTYNKLQKAPDKIMQTIARITLDYTGSKKVVANSTGASYELPAGHNSGQTERSMYIGGVSGDLQTGYYIGNWTDYASYVYPKTGVNWTNPNTQTKWFEFIWEKYGTGITNNAIKVNEI